MTYTPPPERRSNDREPLGFDDFLALLVAFTGIGAIFAWGLNQVNPGFDLSFLPRTAPVASPFPTQEAVPRSSVMTPVGPSPQSTFPGLEPSPAQTSGVFPVPLPANTAQPRQTGFSDVPSDYWASPFIAGLADRGVLNGSPDGTFRPNEPITRAEFSSMIGKAFNAPNQSTGVSYRDVPEQFWAREGINQAEQLGFVRGYPDNTFQPNKLIPKFEALVALATGLKLSPPANPQAVLSRFQDAVQIPAYARDKVAAATTSGLVVNYPDVTTLNPNQAITRANAAALIYQALVHSGKAEAINSEYIVRP